MWFLSLSLCVLSSDWCVEGLRLLVLKGLSTGIGIDTTLKAVGFEDHLV